MTSVLIIGGGPSYKKKLEQARNFKGIIIVHTAFVKIVMDEGITPDYITQYEVDKGLNLEHYPPELKKLEIPIVYNYKCQAKLLNHLTRHKFCSLSFRSNTHHNINNVGLFAAYFAREYLNADKIYLIGFDHEGIDYHANVYPKWVENFKVFVEAEKDKCEIINCSGQGKLYMNGITDGGNLTTFN